MTDVPDRLGDFRITAVLGQGGSGIVYDASWGPRRVALKVLHPTLAGTGKERTQYVAEARRLQAIAHPSVVKVFAAGELPDGRPFLAMERLEGETLAARIARGRLALPQALVMFGELCGAVAALHGEGLVHRDLKPENVFVVDGRHAVLLDFGIAKAIDAPPSTTTQEGTVRGTPAYMAPERFFGQPASVATDVYELALCLYAMLAGRLPWDVHDDPEARLAPKPLRDFAGDVPEPLDVEVRRALSTRAQNRPASAHALHDAVVAAAGGSAVADAPVMTAELRGTKAPVSGEGERERPVSEDKPTPLAWAPTRRASGRASTRRKWIGVAVALGVIGGGVAWRIGNREPRAVENSESNSRSSTVPGSLSPIRPDPWGEHSAAPEDKHLPLVEPERTRDEYRGEIVVATTRLPPGTHLVVTAELGELRAQPQIHDMIAKPPKDPRVQMLVAMMPACARQLVSDSEWLVFGAPSMRESLNGTLIVRGRWQRKDVDCSDVTFLDDHTARIGKPGTGGLSLHARALFVQLPADRAIAIAFDGAGSDDLVDATGLPRGTDVFGWLRALGPKGVELDLAADAHDAAAAKQAAAKLAPQVDKIWGTSSPDAVGRLEVVAQKTVVRIRGNVTALTLGLVSAALNQ